MFIPASCWGGLPLLDVVQFQGHHQVRVDRSRDALITDFGRATLDDRYLLPGESYQIGRAHV